MEILGSSGVQITRSTILDCVKRRGDCWEAEIVPLNCPYEFCQHVVTLLARHDELTSTNINVVVDNVPKTRSVMNRLGMIVLDGIVEPLDHRWVRPAIDPHVVGELMGLSINPQYCDNREVLLLGPVGRYNVNTITHRLLKGVLLKPILHLGLNWLHW